MAKVTTGTVTYTIDAATLKVSSDTASDRMIAAVDRAIQSELLDYSPALGSKLAFVANAVARFVGGKASEVDEPPAEEGVVY